MNQETKVAYNLPRSTEESSRLDTQHQVYVAAIGSFAHPKLGDLSQFKAILDNACGTAVWLQSALNGGTEQVKINLREDVIAEGADISDRQFPPKELRHSKLGELYVHNVTEPFPESKRGRYDLIHQRLLIGGMTTPQWPIGLRNLFDALQPGGYFSSTELNLDYHRDGVDDTDLPACIRTANRMFRSIHEKTNKTHNPATMMAQWMAEAGFVEVETVPIKQYFGTEDNQASAESLRDLFRNIAPACLRLGGCEGLTSAEEAEEMIKACEAEVMAKPIYINVVVTVGRRPL